MSSLKRAGGLLMAWVAAGAACTAPGTADDDDSTADAAVADAGGARDAGALPDAGAGADAGGNPGVDAGPLWARTILAEYTDVAHGMAYAGGLVYAASYQDNTVRVFDGVTHQALASVPTGPGPSALLADNYYVYSINRMAVEYTDEYLTIIDTATHQRVHGLNVSTHLEGGDPNNYPTTGAPWNGTLLGGKLYITFPTNAVPNILSVEEDFWNESPFFAAGSGPEDLVGVDGKLFVINGRVMTNADDDAVAVYAPDGTLQEVLETGGRLTNAVTANGKVFIARHITDAPKGELLAIDVQTHVVLHLMVGRRPYGLTVERGLVWVVCQYDNWIDIVDPLTLAVVGRVPLDGYQPPIVNPRGIAVSPDGEVYLESDGMISALTPP